MESDRIVDLLAATPTRLRELHSRLGQSAAGPVGPDEWSAAEVLEHLFAADAILAPRLLQILVRPGVALPAFDERVWATLVARAGLTLAQRLDLFAAQRAALVGLARTLTPAEWALEGEHEVAGRRSVHQIASHLVGHEQEHVEQLRALVEPAP